MVSIVREVIIIYFSIDQLIYVIGVKQKVVNEFMKIYCRLVLQTIKLRI